MGEPEDIEVGGEEESKVVEAPREGFSIGKLIEWLLANLIPIIIAVVVSTIIAMIIVRTSVAKKSKETYETVKITGKPEPLDIFQLDDFKVNTADLDEPHFVRLFINLGYDGDNKKLAAELIERKVQLRDLVLGILNSKYKTEIDSETEKQRLKEEIKNAINNVLKYGEIEAVYYHEFVIS